MRLKTIPNGQEDVVKLPSLLGLRPGVYIAGLLAALVVLLLFFLLLHPGISRPGSVLEVSSEPDGAAVRVDDVYYAASPARIFADKGTRRITLVSPGFEPYETVIHVEGRLFASRFFPKKMIIKARLTETEPLAALKNGAREYAMWSLAGEPTEDYQIPLALSDAALRGPPRDGESAQKARELLACAARFMVTEAAVKDLTRAVFLCSSGGLAASPVGMTGAVREVLSYMNNTPAFSIALVDVLPVLLAEKLVKSSAYPQVWTEADAQKPAWRRRGAPFRLLGMEFSAEFDEAVYVQQSGFQRASTVGPFYIGLEEVSYGAWRQFLAENPAWRPENRAELIDRALVNEDYLAPFTSDAERGDFIAEMPDYPGESISYVSFYAAQAFCAWLTQKLPAALRDYEARLPTEAEWEYAAYFAENNPRETGLPRRITAILAGRSGELVEGAGLWEWCSDAFAPLAYLPAGAEISLTDERAVRGGSWINQPGTVTAQMRGSLPASACSAFTGFRAVIAPKAPLPAGAGG
ncbi:MAG: SUMF1/EgtB/PvdO family nonheme iron enzyme [Spirochaetaceae bacterium]|jgi:hypothetical protein|nr:SUMF1/EgtB/PvdO family nonheme iron enzyme [Spirochaetaceae bacterium]